MGPKLEIVTALAALLAQLRDHEIDRIGNLYFKGRERHPGPEKQSKAASLAHSLSIDSL